MLTRNLGKVQEALDALNPVQRDINELKYYRKVLNSPNHSSSLCSSVQSMIDTLSQQHSEVVNALIFYGNTYQGMDERLAMANNPDNHSNGVSTEFTYISAPEHQKEFWEKTWNQITLGDYCDDVTWLGSTVSIVAAFFGVDAPMDVRDFTANVSKGQWGWAIVSAVSLLPIVGFIGKGGRVISKSANAIDSVAVLKSGNIIDSAYTIGGKTYKTVDGVFSGVNSIDDLAIPFRQSNKLLWESSSSHKYVLSEDSFIFFNKYDTIDSSVDGVKYLPDFKYIKKTDAELKALRKTFDSGVRADFVKKLASENEDALKKLKLTDIEIGLMKKGELPPGFEVHHKLSLDDGGDNSFENLILIQEDFHKVFTFYQNAFTKTKEFLVNEYAVVDWVIPTGQVNIPKFTNLPLIQWGN